MKLFLLLTTLLMGCLPAYAADPLKVTYGIYTSGFNVVDIDGTYVIGKDTYDLEMDMKTVGMLGTLAPWAGVIDSNGMYDQEKSKPLQYSFASKWRGKVETTNFVFGKNGKLTSHILIDEDGNTHDKMPATEVYADNPVDMLSAMFRAAHGKTCESVHPVMDGKRRFDMVFRSVGKDVRKKNRYSIFSGETEICEVEIVPVAGKWRDKPRGWMSIQGQAKENGQLPRLWFGKVRDDLPPIPVRFMIKTNYGTMLMHLKGVE